MIFLHTNVCSAFMSDASIISKLPPDLKGLPVDLVVVRSLSLVTMFFNKDFRERLVQKVYEGYYKFLLVIATRAYAKGTA